MSKNVLLTGGAGFIGHHTAEHILRNTDWTITIMDKLTYAGSLKRLMDIECWHREQARVKFYFHDFRATVKPHEVYALWDKNPDYIIHMGAESHVDRSITNAMPFVLSNVVGTVNMLEYARLAIPEKFIYVSTDEVYGPVSPNSPEMHQEGEPHKPSNPYSASKASAEDFCRAYMACYSVPVIITNTMNNYGERQDPEKFVPKTMKAILDQRPVVVHCRKDEAGNILDISSRCWLHARNHAAALLFLLERGKIYEQYNVVGQYANVETMAGMIARYMDREWGVLYEDFHSFRKGHDMHYGLDGLKLMNLGFHYPVDFDVSLEKTIKWTMDNREWLQ